MENALSNVSNHTADPKAARGKPSRGKKTNKKKNRGSGSKGQAKGQAKGSPAVGREKFAEKIETLAATIEAGEVEIKENLASRLAIIKACVIKSNEACAEVHNKKERKIAAADLKLKEGENVIADLLRQIEEAETEQEHVKEQVSSAVEEIVAAATEEKESIIAAVEEAGDAVAELEAKRAAGNETPAEDKIVDELADKLTFDGK